MQFTGVCVSASVLFNFGRSAASIISHKEILILK